MTEDTAFHAIPQGADIVAAALEEARDIQAKGSFGAALTRLEQLPAALRDRPRVQIQRCLALIELDRPEEAEACARKALAQSPGLGRAYLLICRAVLASAAPERLVDVLNEALDAGADLTGFGYMVRNLALFPEADTAELRKTLAARFPEQSAIWLADFDHRMGGAKGETGAFHLALRGDRAQALSALTDDSAEVRSLGSVAEAQVLIRAIPGPDRRKRELVVDDGADIVISPVGGSGTTVVVFTGLARRTMVDVEVLDAFFAEAGISAIYLRDPSRNLYLNGIPSIGPGRSDFVAVLRMHLRALETRRITTFGTSAGGFSAIVYGLELGAGQVISCAGPTALDAGTLAALGDDRGRIMTRRLQSLFSPSDLDLRGAVEGATPDTRITIAFGAGVPVDVAHARRLADLPNVSLLSIDGHARHNIIAPMLASGHLMALLTS